MTNLTTIDPTQRRVHVVAETIAIVGVMPFLVWAATRRRKLQPVEKGVLVSVALGTVLIDGWLLHRFLRRASKTP
jgi:hypothetical protein